MAAGALVTGLLEESSLECYVCLVGSSEDGLRLRLRLRLRLSLVPGSTRPSPAEHSPFASTSSVETSALDWAFVNIVHNIWREGSSSPPSGRHGRS
jgi:hypothetical protein